MKKFHITGSTAGLYPKQIEQKFDPLALKLMQMGAEEVTWPKYFPGFQQVMDDRYKKIAAADCVIFFDDWKESIESQFEFKEANRLNKDIRFNTTSDINDIQRTLRNSSTLVVS